MKKRNFKTGILALIAALSSDFVFGQSGVLPASKSIQVINSAPSAAPVDEKKGAEVSVSAKAARALQKNFNAAENVYWFKDKKDYCASFAFRGMNVLAWFVKSGYLYCTIYYGSAKDLPRPEKELIQSTYQDYDITATQEIYFNGAHAWVITMQNCKNFNKVRIQDGELHLLEHFNKTN